MYLHAAVAVAALAVLIAGPAAAESRQVTFPGAEGVMLFGWIYTPSTPGPHPAIVALHGCAGLFGKDGLPSARHADWGERWATAGYVVLFPDSYGSRGLGPQCKTAERSIHPGRERVDDANAALHFLIGRADIDAKQISLVGWSNGGSTALYAVQPRNSPTKANGGADFARAISFYPGCRTPLETARWRTRSSSVGMPIGRISPSVPLGMYTRRTGGAWYEPDFARCSRARRLASRLSP